MLPPKGAFGVAPTKYTNFAFKADGSSRKALSEISHELVNAQVEVLKRGNGNANAGEGKSFPSGGKNNNKKGAPKWKSDHSLSSGNELKKNGKTYKWCTGPGHNGNGMWVTHPPGKCTAQGQGGTSDRKTFPGSKTVYDRQALTSILQQKGNFTKDEVESKVDAMLAVMDS